MSPAAEVHAAAAALVEAFASNDTARYFACFSDDATFIFHTQPHALTLAGYQALWQQWQAEGFAVLGCRSSHGQVSLQGDVAIFLHDVATHLRADGAEHHLEERETIVFRHQAGRWLACHEHLSAPSPN
ncbi:nuclear transport factor 2 family protein [Pseudomonas sp. RP23018S]|uniref:YybH family protein n=1 Tax=Pseudomonas sp. RP23018S TaxID=3096037 RepID=UPI002ACA8E6A|nr:nuclear transport factor 2 family protein [Pseudomonas sp. RP23018S]MDZ5602460.1 nuclear transport factor 2 family protein [Pseudomonas sp. RP23018S]